MTVEHRLLPDDALHELKGAASAVTNTSPIADGAGSTTFGFIDFNNLVNRPVTLNTSGTPVFPRRQYISVAAVAGVWTAAITGFSSVFYVSPVVVAPGVTLGTVATASLSSFTNTTATGAVIIHSASANSLGTTQTVLVEVVGV